MQKRVWLIVVMIVVLIASMALAVACSNKDKTPADDSSDGIIDDGGNNAGDDNGVGVPSDGIVDISQFLTYELNEDGNSYAVTGLTEEGYDLAKDEKLLEDISKGQGKYKLSIPDSHLDKPVTSIKGVDRETSGEGAIAFYMCTLIAEVRLPDTITSIGYEAFSYCASLTSISIPNSVTSIGDNAFEGCYRLIEV